MKRRDILGLDYKANKNKIDQMLLKLEYFQNNGVGVKSLESYCWKIRDKQNVKLKAIMIMPNKEFVAFCEKRDGTNEFQITGHSYVELLKKFILYCRYNKVMSNE